MPFAASVLALAALAGGQTVEKKMPPFEEMVRMRIVLSIPGMDAVTARRDVVYKTAGADALKMDVYSPPGPARPRPAVLLVHGGPIPTLGAKNMGVFRSYGELLAASGFVAVAFDHRFLAPSRLADAASDVADLIAAIRQNAATLGIDSDRIAIWAFSGGRPVPGRAAARAAGLAARRTRLLCRARHPATPTGSPRQRRRSRAARALLRDPRARRGRAHGTSPARRSRRARPSLAERRDRPLRAEALARGATLDLLNHPDGRHGFDILDDDARTKEILRRALDFLRERLTP
jgi:carboxylesterase type B